MAGPQNGGKAAPSGSKKPFDYEFMGPIGTFFIMLTMPLVVIGLYAFCNDEVGCSLLPPPVSVTEAIDTLLRTALPLVTWLDMAMVVGWFAFHVALHVILPGPIRKGVVNADGSQFSYKLNGLLELIISLSAVIGAHAAGWVDMTIIYTRFVNLSIAALILSLTVTVYCYAISFVPGTLLAESGSSGNPIYDMFMGRALTPRFLGLDLKFFCEQRPGLSAWALINIACLVQQYNNEGYVSNGMWVAVGLSVFYVIDTFIFEEAVLTTADITTEGFGYMLAVGDLFWVPFSYTLQARYLVIYPDDLSVGAAATIAAVGMVGYYIFRMSNLEKHLFRHHPDHPRSKRLQYMPTERGSKLIISGWWGTARHINYFGDWLLSLAQCIAAGRLTSIVPYWFAIYFAVLLIHRELRDEHKCSVKYGADWVKYCKLVPYRIIPYVY